MHIAVAGNIGSGKTTLTGLLAKHFNWTPNSTMHIAVAGNIGSGKTTLTGLLAKHFNWTPHYEEVEHNPYLDSFYEDMQRWSFNIQIFFLNSRFRQVMDIRNSGKDVIQDRTIYEDAHIFAANLYSMGLMETRDFENYQSLFELMTKFLQPPDLLIYLRASVPTLIRHIAKRNREFEQSISISYLTNLNERYEKWIEGYKEGKLLIIDTDNIELENPEDLSTVVDRIEGSLNGLF